MVISLAKTHSNKDIHFDREQKKFAFHFLNKEPLIFSFFLFWAPRHLHQCITYSLIAFSSCLPTEAAKSVVDLTELRANQHTCPKARSILLQFNDTRVYPQKTLHFHFSNSLLSEIFTPVESRGLPLHNIYLSSWICPSENGVYTILFWCVYVFIITGSLYTHPGISETS